MESGETRDDNDFRIVSNRVGTRGVLIVDSNVSEVCFGINGKFLSRLIRFPH